MKTITIGNLKGGVGKTTTAVNLAYSLSLQEKRVLVIDADPQTNVTPFFTKANSQGRTLMDVLEHPEKMKRCIYKSKYPYIDIIKGNTGIVEADAGELGLSQALGLVENQYDYCVIDTRPAFENLTADALYASDIMLTPVCLDKFCRDNLALVDEYLDRLEAETGHNLTWKIFANKVDSARKAQRKIFEDLVTKHDYPLLETCVSRSAVVDNALELYKPVQKHRRSSQVARDYEELAKEVAGLQEG